MLCTYHPFFAYPTSLSTSCFWLQIFEFQPFKIWNGFNHKKNYQTVWRRKCIWWSFAEILQSWHARIWKNGRRNQKAASLHITSLPPPWRHARFYRTGSLKTLHVLLEWRVLNQSLYNWKFKFSTRFKFLQNSGYVFYFICLLEWRVLDYSFSNCKFSLSTRSSLCQTRGSFLFHLFIGMASARTITLQL